MILTVLDLVAIGSIHVVCMVVVGVVTSKIREMQTIKNISKIQALIEAELGEDVEVKVISTTEVEH